MLCHQVIRQAQSQQVAHTHIRHKQEEGRGCCGKRKKLETKVRITYLGRLAHTYNTHSLLQQSSNQPINSHIAGSRGYNLPPLSLGQNQSG